MFSNPEMLHSMMDNPLVQQVVSNPDLLRQLITSNPQIRELIEVSTWMITRSCFSHLKK